MSLRSLFPLIGGDVLPAEDDGPSRRTQIVFRATVVAAALASVYGFALGGDHLATGFANLVRLPMVVLVAGAGALPAGLLAWKVVGAPGRVSDLVVALASGTLTGTLLLAALAPVIGLYAFTTEWFGAVLALVVALLAVLVGLATAVRAVLVRRPAGTRRRRVLVPAMVLIGVHLATLSQLVAIADLMPEATALDGGVEGVVPR